MAQQEYSISLVEAEFPMLSEQQSRTVIGASNREAAGSAGFDVNKPGIQYCENVMPTKDGIKTISFQPAVAAISNLGPTESVSDIRTIYGDKGTEIQLTWDSTGIMWALIKDATDWISIPDPTPSIIDPAFTTNDVTVGTVELQSYIYFRQLGCFTYNETTNTLDAVTLTGLDVSTIVGIAAAQGYLVAYTHTAIAWSSTVTPTDFVPSEVTGAGGGEVADIRGLILVVVSSYLGLVIYSNDNAVAATYTGNPRYPFKFRPIKNSKGGTQLDKITYEANSGRHFVWGHGGLQTVESTNADIILPQVTDFLSGKRLEHFLPETRELVIQDLDESTNIQKKLNLIASRYLVISYGTEGYQYALIYDFGLNRLGKIKLVHSDVFELHRTGVEDTKQSIGFMLPTGEVRHLNFEVNEESEGVIILGKLQFTRTRLLNLQEVEIENIQEDSVLSVSTNLSYTGKADYYNVDGELIESGANWRKYGFIEEAVNHSLVFIGEFEAVTATVKYFAGGRR